MKPKHSYLPTDPLYPAVKPKKVLSATGKPTKVNVNNENMNEETGAQVISANFPGQKESIKKALKADKDSPPLTASAEPAPPNKTVRKVKTHIPDVKAVEARAPFSFSAVKKLLYQ